MESSELKSSKTDLEHFHLDNVDAENLSVDYTNTEEHKVVWKCDLHVVPILMLLYLLAFLDRINIGNARLQGLEDDLNMEGAQYNYALFIFFIPYILCEVPCNLIMKKLAPSTWISGIMAAWGCVYLISTYYKRFELQWRLNLFFSASIISGAISGVRHLLFFHVNVKQSNTNSKYELLAYGLSYMDGVCEYSSWRWIFILEGIATVVVGLGAKVLIVDWPEEASFLGERERTILLTRLGSENDMFPMNRLNRNAVWRILSDKKIYLGIIMYLGTLDTGYAASFFIPTILRDMDWTSLMSQVMSIPIYIVAAIMTISIDLALSWPAA
ncbi:unnamed protein product [Penicillium olsonii]|nr:unnamed protein product [Penicillium olsonii]CAG7931842.1 unnamed protein product [Penicillium olsonii]